MNITCNMNASFSFDLFMVYVHNVSNRKELWNNTCRYEILHTLNLRSSFITLGEVFNNIVLINGRFHNGPVYNYEFWLSLCKIVRSSVILLLPLLSHNGPRKVVLALGVASGQYNLPWAIMTNQPPENCENRNDPDLVQAFLKKWWVESDFKAPTRGHITDPLWKHPFLNTFINQSISILRNF
jgi:hypothetical protein